MDSGIVPLIQEERESKAFVSPRAGYLPTLDTCSDRKARGARETVPHT